MTWTVAGPALTRTVDGGVAVGSEYEVGEPGGAAVEPAGRGNHHAVGSLLTHQRLPLPSRALSANAARELSDQLIVGDVVTPVRVG
ncbi:MAG: hypothetical protein ACRDSL_08080 [Pseudonocardiaceae bacterium]